jgi:tetratricopeptide (TPR) repeat protein
MIVTFPIVLLLFDYLLYRKLDRWCLLEKIPFFMLSIIFGVLNIFAQKAGGSLVVKKTFNVIYNLFIALKSLVFYLTKTIAPLNLSAIYPSPDHQVINILSTEFLLPALLLFALAITIFYSRKWTRKIIFGSLFFFITILPVLKLIPVGDWVFAADRYMYIPSIGLFYMIGATFVQMYEWSGIYEKARRISLVFLLSMVIIIFSVLTYQRNKVWKNSETLWLNVIKNHPDVALAHNNLGLAYYNKGQLNKAIMEYKEAVKLNPVYTKAYYNIGLVYYYKGLIDASIASYQNALKFASDIEDIIDINNNLGIAYATKGFYMEAVKYYQEVLRITPDDPVVLNNLKIVYNMIRYHKTLEKAK